MSTQIIDMNSLVSVSILCDILGMSRGAVYNDAKSGKFGPKEISEQTYKEAIQNYRNYFTSGGRAHYANASAEGDSLVERQLVQKLRTDRATEVKTWLAIAEKRNQLLSEKELIRLYEPFIHILKNAIISISLDHPETRTKVDSVLNSLAELGRTMVNHSEADADVFLKEMLELDLDDDLLRLSFIPDELLPL